MPDLREDQPWPLTSIVSKLADFADHLLTNHSCDTFGYEQVVAARDAGREWLRVQSQRYGWHGEGDLCLGPECGVTDADGDHPSPDVHSNDWYEGYEAAQRERDAAAAEPETDPEALHLSEVARAERQGFKVGVKVVDEGVVQAAGRVTCDRCHRPLQNVHRVAGQFNLGRVCAKKVLAKLSEA